MEKNAVTKVVHLEGYYSFKPSKFYSACACTQERRHIRKNDIIHQFIFTSFRKLDTSFPLMKRKT